MARSASLFILCAVASATAGSALQQSALVVAAPEPTPSCETCEFIWSLVEDFSDNATSWAELIGILDESCAIAFASDPANLALCDIIVAAGNALLPWLDSQINTLAWDAPEAVCALFGFCAVPCCEHPTAVEQVRLAFNSSDMSEMRVTYVTLNKTGTTTIQYGPAGSLSNSVTGTDGTYTFAGWVGRIHTAVMTGLRPGTEYSYRVGDASGGWSAIYNFSTLAANAGTTANPLKIVQIGDMGYGDRSNDTVARLEMMAKAGEIDMIVHVGDISYADGEQDHWDMFFRKVQEISARVPYLSTGGNHEIWANFLAYQSRNIMPLGPARPGGPTPDPKQCIYGGVCMYFSLELPSLHLVMMHSESSIDTADLDAAQVAWLTADLKAYDRSKAWTIANFHRPMYCTDSNSNDCGLFANILKAQAEKVLYDNRVELVITAHMHGYERTWPLYNGTKMGTSYVDPVAPTHVVNGAAGNREGNEKPKGGPDWSVFGSGEYGFALIKVSGPSLLSYSFIKSSDGEVLDTWNITKTTL